MPETGETRAHVANADMLLRAIEAVEAVSAQEFGNAVTAAMKQQGFTKILKSLNKGRFPKSAMMTVQEGVVEKLPSGLYDAAFQTDKGRLVFQNAGAKWKDGESTDLQFVSSSTSSSYEASPASTELTAEEILGQLTAAGANMPCSLLCQVELTRFDPSQREVVLPLLWQYILDHRNSNNRDELIAVGAAIRKYIAIMPMDRMGELAVLLETGHRSPLPIDLEIEVAKMICRNFEVYPPVVADPHPELAKRLWEIVQAYINPRVLLRDKHPAATSLAIEAIVSMRSPLAEQAWQAANACPYRWFAELVSDDLDGLREAWGSKSPDAAAWLCELRNNVLAHV